MPTPLKHQKGAIIIEGHVQGLSNTRSLGEAGVPVIVLDTNDCIARYSKYCTKFFKCPPFESDELAEFLIKLGEEQNLKGWLLLPSNDHGVLTISRNKEKLEKTFKVITPGIEIIQNIYDKSCLLEIAVKTGVPVPETFYALDAKAVDIGLRFPVLTKGKQGRDFYKAVGRKAFLAANPLELHAQLEKIAKTYPIAGTFTQELIPDDGTNKTVSFTAFCIDGEIKTYWMGVKLREHPVRFGTATLAKSVFIKECYELSVPLLKALNYTGVCEVEYLKDPRDYEYKLIEINARTWLWVGLAKKCGIDFAKIIYDYVNDNDVSYPDDYRKDVCWINRITDYSFSLLAAFKGKLSLKNFFRTVCRKKSDAFFRFKDIKPFFMYFILVFQFLRKR